MILCFIQTGTCYILSSYYHTISTTFCYSAHKMCCFVCYRLSHASLHSMKSLIKKNKNQGWMLFLDYKWKSDRFSNERLTRGPRQTREILPAVEGPWINVFLTFRPKPLELKNVGMKERCKDILLCHLFFSFSISFPVFFSNGKCLIKWRFQSKWTGLRGGF